MTSKRIDTRAIGLEVGCELATWLTGAPNLHYGLWDGLAPVAANLGVAQRAYTDRLIGLLPAGPLDILDIGGGAGVTARRLMDLGHRVTIVVPSDYLAARCAEIAPGAAVFETTFEAFESGARFDLCLFSESFQYIPMQLALDKALGLTRPGGHVLIADCFRSDAMQVDATHRPAGGGHPATAFHAALDALPVERLAAEDITESVAPSIDVEQALYSVFGVGLSRVDAELTRKRPRLRGGVLLILRALLGRRRLARLDGRLRGQRRTSEAFIRDNRYLINLLRKTG